jgi:predicted anti-sigma-YlaC factor YlaD
VINAAHPVGPEEVMAYLDGELAADRAVTVSTHVDGCLECRKLVRDLQAVSRRMGEWEVGACGLRAVGERPVVRPAVSWKRWAGVLTFAFLVVCGASLVLYRVATNRPASALSYNRGFFQGPRLLTQREQTVARPPGQTNMSYDMVKTSRPITPTLRSEGFTEQTGDITLTVMIARTAQLALITNDFVHSRERMEAILKAHHGYVGQLTMSAPGGAGRTLDAALKVPSSELDASMAELKKLGRVETESQSGEEVTQQYVDLVARLANSRNAEQRLTAVLQQRTGKMQDVLEVEKEITRVRGEIEQMEAEQKTLSKRVEFATINVKISEQYKAQLQGPESIGTRLGNAAVAGYRHVADGAMGLAEFGLEYGLSFAIWMAVLFWPARWIWKRYGTKAAG